MTGQNTTSIHFTASSRDRLDVLGLMYSYVYVVGLVCVAPIVCFVGSY